MDFSQILVLCLRQLRHALHVLHVPVVTFDESFLVVHDVLVRRLFQPINLNGPEMRVVNILNEEQFGQVFFHLVTCRYASWYRVAHFGFLMCFFKFFVIILSDSILLSRLKKWLTYRTLKCFPKQTCLNFIYYFDSIYSLYLYLTDIIFLTSVPLFFFSILKKDNLNLFLDKVGFSIMRKQNKLKDHLK